MPGATVRNTALKNDGQTVEKTQDGPRPLHKRSLGACTVTCRPQKCGAHICPPGKPTTKDLTEHAAVRCQTCKVASDLAYVRCATCKGHIKLRPFMRTLQMHGPTHLEPSDRVPEHTVVRFATEYRGCDATIAALRALPVNFAQLRRSDDAPNPADFSNVNYHIQIALPRCLHPPPPIG